MSEQKKKPFPFISIILILLCIICWLLVTREGMQLEKQYTAFRERTSGVVAEGFLPGIQVDGIDLGGKSMEEARALFAARAQQQRQALSVVIRSGDRKWRITSDEVPLVFDADQVLRKAWVYGHYGSLEKRMEDRRLAEKGVVTFTTSYHQDRSRVSELVKAISDSLTFPAENARLDAFDDQTHIFTFSEGKKGQAVESARLEEMILDALEKEEDNAVIDVPVIPLFPELSAADLEGHFGLVSTYTTETTRDRNRNRNIALSSEALNGRVVQPGETLSFNGCTGKRTPEKGYREAHAIAGGVYIDDYGGGVCQTSSTLFNAVIRADLEIVKRYAHSFPSSYVPRGEDATVNWPSRDFVFRNNTDYPVFLLAWYDNYKVTVEIYGKLPDTWSSIDLESKTTRTIKPEPGIEYTLDESLPEGTRQKGHDKHTGYEVDTYKIYYAADGSEIHRDKLWTTIYPMMQEQILYH